MIICEQRRDTGETIFITHTNDERRGVRHLAASVCDSACVCSQDKTKPAETTITKLATEISLVHSESSPSNYCEVKKSTVEATGSQSRKTLKATEWPA